MPASLPEHVAAGSTLRADVLIVGAGVAGLVTALDLLDLQPGARIAVLDKGTLGSTGSTPLAQGGMAAALGPGDSSALHAEDTLRAGDGLCDPAAVRVMAAEAPARIGDLVRRGARFDREGDGTLHLAREGAQSVARCVHAADATGAEIFRTLRTAAAARVTRLQGIACELIESPADAAPRISGVWALLDAVDAAPSGPRQEGGLVCLRAHAVVLATGGCGGLFALTTNRPGATADGVALAARARAALIDLEFVQFHPTALRTDEDGFGRLLLTEALRGAGAVLVDRHGRRFMPERHPDAELAPRHVVTKAILDHADGAWLDATHLGADRIAAEFPTAAHGLRHHGLDLAREPVPVAPAQHYMIGGIATDLWGATSLPGLYAAGETACTGVHGANRMAGNSLAQACVVGHRIARTLAAAPPPRDTAFDPDPPTFARNGDPNAHALHDGLRRTMSAGAGPIRTGRTLDSSARTLDDLAAAAGPAPAATRASVEVHQALQVARTIVRAARLREESRGVHWRDDIPQRRVEWAGVRLRLGGH